MFYTPQRQTPRTSSFITYKYTFFMSMNIMCLKIFNVVLLFHKQGLLVIKKHHLNYNRLIQIAQLKSTVKNASVQKSFLGCSSGMQREGVYESYDKVRCPCKNCDNLKWLDCNSVSTHICGWGFVENYKVWIYHGVMLDSTSSQ